MRRLKTLLTITMFGLTSAACGAAAEIELGIQERDQVLCKPGPSPDAGIDETVETDRRVEALVLHLTGIDELVVQEESEGEDIVYDDPNYGGVYGDFNGGLVVAVVDCSLVDADRIAQIAGGPDAVQLIEVPYSFEEVNGFADELLHREVDVSIDSTTSGRWIVVTVEDVGDLPRNYGDGVPEDVFSVVEGERFTAEPAILED